MSNDNIDTNDSSAAEPTMVVPSGSSAFERPNPAAAEPTIDLGQLEAEKARQLDDEDAARREAEARAREEARARAEEKANRERALGVVEPAPEADVAPLKLEKGTNDRFFGALGLFLLRIVTAIVVGVRGIQVLTDIPRTQTALESVNVPSAGPVSWALGITLLVIAVMILFGFGTRVAGVLLAAIAITIALLFYWTTQFTIFQEGQQGIAGDFEALLAAVALVFMFVGAGGWSIDGGMRRARAKRRLYS